MLIAHAPAGYLVGSLMDRARLRPDLVIAGVIGGLLPDLDAVGYHLGIVEGFHRATPFHWPLTWIVVLLVGIGVRQIAPKAGEMVAVIAVAALVHCGLDATMAPLYWAAPLGWSTIEMVEVPGGWHPYWLGFIFYWTFLPEIMIWAAAIWVWRSRRRLDPLPMDQRIERPA